MAHMGNHTEKPEDSMVPFGVVCCEFMSSVQLWTVDPRVV